MRWGRRRSSGASTNDKVIRTSTSEDHDRKVQLRNKRISEMTNAELKAFNERAQLERQYKAITAADVKPGKKFVQDFVAKQAKQALDQYASKYTAKLVDDLLKKTMK